MIWPFLPGGVAQTVVAAVPNTAKIANAVNVRMSAPFVRCWVVTCTRLLEPVDSGCPLQ